MEQEEIKLEPEFSIILTPVYQAQARCKGPEFAKVDTFIRCTLLPE